MADQMCKWCNSVIHEFEGGWADYSGYHDLKCMLSPNSRHEPASPSGGVAQEEGTATKVCSACGHELPQSLIDESGKCELCRPLTDDQIEIVEATYAAQQDPQPAKDSEPSYSYETVRGAVEWRDKRIAELEAQLNKQPEPQPAETEPVLSVEAAQELVDEIKRLRAGLAALESK